MGYFKLNSKILENEEYNEIIKQLILKYPKKLVLQNTDTRILWDVLKLRLEMSQSKYVNKYHVKKIMN